MSLTRFLDKNPVAKAAGLVVATSSIVVSIIFGVISLRDQRVKSLEEDLVRQREASMQNQLLIQAQLQSLSNNCVPIDSLPAQIRGTPAQTIARITQLCALAMPLDIDAFDKLFVDIQIYQRTWDRTTDLNQKSVGLERKKFLSNLDVFLAMIAQAYPEHLAAYTPAEKLKQFQRFCGLEPDGKLGKVTWGKLLEAHKIIDEEFIGHDLSKDPDGWKRRLRDTLCPNQ